MIENIIVAIIVAVAVGLLLLYVGRAIKSSGASVPILVTTGGFLEQFCWLIGLIVGAVAYIEHWRPF